MAPQPRVQRPSGSSTKTDPSLSPLPSSFRKPSLLPFLPIPLHTRAAAAPATNTATARGPAPTGAYSQGAAAATPGPSLQEGAPQALPGDITSQPFPTRKGKTSQDENKGERKTHHRPPRGARHTWAGRETSAAASSQGNPHTPPRHSCPQGLCPSARFRIPHSTTTADLPPTQPRQSADTALPTRAHPTNALPRHHRRPPAKTENHRRKLAATRKRARESRRTT